MKPKQRVKILAAAAILATTGAIAQTLDSPLPPPPSGMPPAQTQPAPPAPAPPAAPPDSAGGTPAGLESIRVGVLELSPAKAIARLSRQRHQTCIDAVVSFRVRNTGPADMRLALFATSLAAVDTLGIDILGRADFLRTSGITDSKVPQEQWPRFLNESRSQMSVISPGQTINVQIQPASAHGRKCVDDKDGNFFSAHRPPTYTLSGSVGVADLTDRTEVRGFSFSDVPLDVIAN